MARLSLLQLTETALSQHATEQEKARLETLGCFRIGSAPSGEPPKRPEAGRRAETTFPMSLWGSLTLESGQRLFLRWSCCLPGNTSL